MKSKPNQIRLAIGCLLLAANACVVSFFPTEKDSYELTKSEVAITNQVQLQTSVAQTVEALGPKAESDNDRETDQPEDTLIEAASSIQTPLPCNKPNFQNETIPDNSDFDPGESFTKTWTIRNEGTCSWTTDYRLVFTGGDQMGGPSSISFKNTINPGESVTLSVNLKAPGSDGTYTGTWKIEANDGERFGNYWATIVVGGEESETDFAVTSVDFSSSDQMKVGFCPQLFNLQAEITVNGKGTVKYHWGINNGYESGVETLKFDSAGTKTVILSRNFSCIGTSTCSYLVELYIDSPNNQKFGTWPIAIHCL
jgi:hypothetical protein